MKNREFDVSVKIQKDESTDQYDLTLSLSSTFSGEELPDYYKNFSKIENEIEENQKHRFLEMIYNFLKNNLNVEEEG